ncbi:MAG: DeoR/GlpR transcriptional regulator, partial [Rhizobium sp.]|nr:DeoR/GlpR transcriptional regulator [Rhizobium sp.]
VELTGASPATIRRDLTDLEGHGQLRKVHGGAVAVNLRGTPMPYSLRSAENAESKTAIAQLVSRLVTDDMSVIIDNGSTMVAVAQALQERPITALCLSLRAALPLGEGGVATVSTPDGTLMPESLRYEAASCLRALGAFRADVAIIGTCSASPAMGLTVTTPQAHQETLTWHMPDDITALGWLFDLITLLQGQPPQHIHATPNEQKIRPW